MDFDDDTKTHNHSFPQHAEQKTFAIALIDRHTQHNNLTHWHLPGERIHLGYDEINFACWESDATASAYMAHTNINSAGLLNEYVLPFFDSRTSTYVQWWMGIRVQSSNDANYHCVPC